MKYIIKKPSLRIFTCILESPVRKCTYTIQENATQKIYTLGNNTQKIFIRENIAGEIVFVKNTSRLLKNLYVLHSVHGRLTNEQARLRATSRCRHKSQELKLPGRLRRGRI